MQKKPYIILKMEYINEESWGEFSAFMQKFHNREWLIKDNVLHIQSYLCKEQVKDNKEFVNIANRDIFKPIRKPENLLMEEQYLYVFMVQVDCNKLSDVTELWNFYLIWREYYKEKVILWINGKEADYFKVSHFMRIVNECYDDLYNSIFFRIQNKIRLQRLAKDKKIPKKILPMLPIDGEAGGSDSDFFRMPFGNFVSEDIFDAQEDSKGWTVMPIVLRGTCRVLYQFWKKTNDCTVKEYLTLINQYSTLTVILGVYWIDAHDTSNKQFPNGGRKTLQQAFQTMEPYARGILQLIENVSLHSFEKRGIILLRLLEKKDVEYLKSYYNVVDLNNEHIEIRVADYTASTENLNIAENFRIKYDGYDDFEQLKPADFFNEGSRVIWQKFYEDTHNVAKHFGLRIFAAMVNDYNGIFLMHSHASHEMRVGESFSWTRNSVAEKTFCMPGTCYSILLPLKQKVEDGFDVDMADKMKIDDNIEELMKYESVDIKLKALQYEGRKKQDIIDGLVEDLKKQVDDHLLYRLVIINAETYHKEEAEVIYKALISAMVNWEASNQLVLFNCEQPFVDAFLTAMKGGYDNNALRMHLMKERYIHLFEKTKFKDTIVVPGNVVKTDQLGKRMLQMPQEENIIPVDVIAEITDNGKMQTIFEHYAQRIICNDIQMKELGCKLNHVHMRLGSTIHVDAFYEAEILFGNKLFVDRFALLACLYIYGLIEDIDKLTLYGYTNSAELVISKMLGILNKYNQRLNVDYMILDRTKDEQEFMHVDAIRYSSTQCWENEDERKEYFKNRKIVCIIPIATTMKTNERMISLFCEKNKEEYRDNFLANLELILVSSQNENQYWEKGEGRSIKANFETNVKPSPHYFVEVQLKYEEPGSCIMCFPKKLINEMPLVEVNPSSTIPIQEFGVIQNLDKGNGITKTRILKIESELACLKDCMLYGHYRRGESHFTYYIQTEQLIYQHQKSIKNWLLQIRNNMELSEDNYYIMFSPAHYSNALFLQCVNDIVFKNMVLFLIRDDMDKEYRNNFEAKYSNIRQLVQRLDERKMLDRLKLIYVDDNIISGKTFFRAVSLLRSLTNIAKNDADFFDAVIVLVDRNSESSREQYIKNNACFYSFCDLKISSMRNHSNACLGCNLEREARILSRSAVTSSTYEYWNSEEKKFGVKGINNAAVDAIRESVAKDKRERAFRRLVCTHTAKKILDNGTYGNNREETLVSVMLLLLEGSKRKSKFQSREHFISYAKVISRPFIVYRKEVKEAIFDVLLFLIEDLMDSGRMFDETLSLATKKEYLRKEPIQELIIQLVEHTRKLFSDNKSKNDLFMVLLKQLTELKSNYIIRVCSINNMDNFIKNVLNLSPKKYEAFYENYISLVKKLLGVSSDTSKCVWFDYILYKGHEEGKEGDTLKLPAKIREWLYLENTRVFQDAYDKLDRIIKSTDELRTNFFDTEISKINEEHINKLGKQIEANMQVYQFKDFRAIMQRYDLLEKNGYNQVGLRVLAGNLLLLKFLKTQFDTKIDSSNAQDKCDRLAVFMKYALNASEVTVFMEIDAEYDAWKDILTERYNRLVGKKEILEGKKEYLVLGTTRDRSISEEVVYINGLEKKLQCLKESRTGWYYSEEDIFLWKVNQMGMHPVYIATYMKEKNYYKNLNYIRGVIQYYVMISDCVFNRSNSNLYHELVYTGKKLLVNTRAKAHSHTANDIKLKQYEHINKNMEIECFRSDVLMLLADLNMSEHFRKSFLREYYINHLNLRSSTWDSALSIFKLGEKKEYQVPSSELAEAIRIEVRFDEILEKGDTLLQPSDKIVCYNVANGARESFLFIYSLIINVAVEGRGLEEDGVIKVNISKMKDGRLRIFNKLGIDMTNEQIEKINEALEKPPSEDKQGISLWTVSRYLECMKAILLRECLDRCEEQKTGDLRKLELCYERIRSEKMKMHVSQYNRNGNAYFSAELPILYDSYIVEE